MRSDRKWACEGKVKYDSFAHAEERIKRAKKSVRNRRAAFHDLRLEPYRCRHCHCWHVGNAVPRNMDGNGHAKQRAKHRRDRLGADAWQDGDAR